MTNNAWYFDVSERMIALSEKEYGRNGRESHGALPQAFKHAKHFLRKLAAGGPCCRPVVGLDDEGTFSFSWSDENLSIDLTVYEDGTYSYFATDGVSSATADDAPVSEGLQPQLLNFLQSHGVLWSRTNRSGPLL